MTLLRDLRTLARGLGSVAPHGSAANSQLDLAIALNDASEQPLDESPDSSILKQVLPFALAPACYSVVVTSSTNYARSCAAWVQ